MSQVHCSMIFMHNAVETLRQLSILKVEKNEQIKVIINDAVSVIHLTHEK